MPWHSMLQKVSGQIVSFYCFCVLQIVPEVAWLECSLLPQIAPFSLSGL